ncbi:armadillo-type protein, partial [Mycena filopes]
QPINFLSLLHPASSPPYAAFVARIIKSADQQASIFLQQKLKVAGPEERGRIVDAICARGGEMMMHRFGNWAVQRCLEAASGPEERRKIVACMRGRVVDLATNCYGCHVLQKALDCEEEEVRLLIVSELLMGDPAQTLVNKHASHVWSKIMELSWTPPAPPIFAYVNKSLKGKWAALACHETGSLVVQHAFENLEESAKDGIVDELLGQGGAVFGEVAKSQWGSYCVQHILEHGSDQHRQMALEHLLAGLLEYATNEQGSKSVVKVLKEGGKDTLDRVVQRMCEPAKGARRAMIVDLALSLTGSQLIASVLPTADKDQRALLYDCIRGHIVTLRGCKTGSKVIWLLCVSHSHYSLVRPHASSSATGWFVFHLVSRSRPDLHRSAPTTDIETTIFPCIINRNSGAFSLSSPSTASSP